VSALSGEGVPKTSIGAGKPFNFKNNASRWNDPARHRHVFVLGLA
jgi:hypothetical protein